MTFDSTALKYLHDQRLEQTALHMATLHAAYDDTIEDSATREHLSRCLTTIEEATHYWQTLAYRAFRLATGRDYAPEQWPAMSAALDAYQHWHQHGADIDSQLIREEHRDA